MERDKRILTVQDISCVGQCSLTVALPILSACGIETAVLPGAVLSTHTGGFTGYTFRDLTKDIPKIAAHWKKEHIDFDAVYTGYLGSAEQVAYVRDLFSTVLRPGGLRIVDPAMADNGALYPGFDGAFVEAMKPLVFSADLILPNLTEAALLCDLPYRAEYDRAYIDTLLYALSERGAKRIVLTGVGFTPKTTGVMVHSAAGTQYYAHPRFVKGCHGTGDVFASAFVGALCRGKSDYEAAVIAANFTLGCIRRTKEDASHWYGVKFEQELPALIAALAKA